MGALHPFLPSVRSLTYRVRYRAWTGTAQAPWTPGGLSRRYTTYSVVVMRGEGTGLQRTLECCSLGTRTGGKARGGTLGDTRIVWSQVCISTRPLHLTVTVAEVFRPDSDTGRRLPQIAIIRTSHPVAVSKNAFTG